MQFIDEAIIEVGSGHGGAGSVHFRREKYKPNMGPDGGDGGKGGDVYFVPTTNMQSLIDFRFQPNFAAQDGEGGRGKDCNGKGGEDLYIKVPVGTSLRDADSGKLLADLLEERPILLLKGGKGGLGNIHFATSTRQAPDYAQPGLPGEKRRILMELKLLADVALVGYPNAGKSTLISQCTAAKPKIAGYPFTTLVPNLGVRRGQSMDYVIADVPGIIEGASDGKGLGIRFLKHIERSRVLIIMLDLDPHTGRKLDMELECLLTEMRKFSAELSERPKFIFINKADAFAAELENTDEDFLKERAYPELQTLIKKLSDTEKLHPNCLYISAVSGQGVKDALALVENELVKLGGEIKRENTLAGDFVWGNRELL